MSGQQESAEPTAISEMALPSEPTPDFPLVAQAPSSFSLPPSESLPSNQHSRSQTGESGELSLPPSQNFPSSLSQDIAESTSRVGLRENVLPEGGSAMPTHLSSSLGLNSQSSTSRNLSSLGLPPIGGSLPASSHSVSSSNPLSSFLPNPTSLSSLSSSIGGSVGSNILPGGGLRLGDGVTSLSQPQQQSHPPQLQPLPPHLSSFSLMNPFAVSSHLQSSSLGMQPQQPPNRAQTQRSSHVTQNLPVVTSASTTATAPPSSQHQLQQQPQQQHSSSVSSTIWHQLPQPPKDSSKRSPRLQTCPE